MTDARVILWGRDIGAVTWLADRRLGVFQYAPEFVPSGIQPAPIMMPLNPDPRSFPALSHEAFMGLPGMLADSLPDKFGHQLIDAWLAGQNREPGSFNPVERLCYVGRRGMGALEFEPKIGRDRSEPRNVDVEALVRLANLALDERSRLKGVISGEDDRYALEDILRVGTSAGGARAKAVLAWNPVSGEFRSGQVDVKAGFEHWLLKFDGVSKSGDHGLADPQGYGLTEYAYYLMAVNAGVEMARCRLHQEGGRSHFMTRRFDRRENGAKLHMQSMAALLHFDYNDPTAYSYEQAFQLIRKLRLPRHDLEQQYVRAAFNIVARNQDDHVKNIAFLMNKSGEWRLSPAFDVTYALQPGHRWLSSHQMSVNGKREGIDREDLMVLADVAGIKRRHAGGLLDRVIEAVRDWSAFAARAGVKETNSLTIGSSHHLEI